MGTTTNALQSTYLLHHLPSTKSTSLSSSSASASRTCFSLFPGNNSPLKTHFFNQNQPNTALVKPILSSFSSNTSPTNKEQKWVHEGTITESLPNGMFWVNCDNGDVILGYVSGKMRRGSIRILPGDRVKIEVSRYDSTRGRIIYRTRS